MVYTSMESPLGRIWLAASPEGLCTVSWDYTSVESFKRWIQIRFKQNPVADQAALLPSVQQLTDYFQNRLTCFHLTLDLQTLSPFDRSVLEETSRIPYGHTTTYGKLAQRIGRPRSARAVGGALGRNPIPIVIPCHRVLSADGKLGGFSGGGPAVKQRLLRLEKAL